MTPSRCSASIPSAKKRLLPRADADRPRAQAGFKRFFVPPCPGDEGVAIGCAAFGWYNRHGLARDPDNNRVGSNDRSRKTDAEVPAGTGVGGRDDAGVGESSSPVGAGLRPPFWGRLWSAEDVEDELLEFESWVESRPLGALEVSMLAASPTGPFLSCSALRLVHGPHRTHARTYFQRRRPTRRLPLPLRLARIGCSREDAFAPRAAPPPRQLRVTRAAAPCVVLGAPGHRTTRDCL